MVDGNYQLKLRPHYAQHTGPEVDIMPKLDMTDSSYYQSLIGVLQWMVELGRVDICLEVSMMSSHLALPREGHMEQVPQIFLNLQKYHNTKLVYDPSNLVIDLADFERRDWTSSEFGHIDGVEELPPHAGAMGNGLHYLCKG